MPDYAQRRILEDIAGQALFQGDAALGEAAVGACLVMLRSRRAGLASLSGPMSLPPLFGVGSNVEPLRRRYPTVGLLARELPHHDRGPDPSRPLGPSLALAAVNSLLPVPSDASDLKAQDLLLQRCRGKSVAVVGHFPFVEKLGGEFAAFSVLELSPRPGDLPASEAVRVLPDADGLLITATTLLNGSLAGLLALLRPGCFTILAGPSAPFAPCLFDYGISAIAGAEVTDTASVAAGIRAGMSFRGLSGVRSLVWLPSKGS